jgi:hypothetical protein
MQQRTHQPSSSSLPTSGLEIPSEMRRPEAEAMTLVLRRIWETVANRSHSPAMHRDGNSAGSGCLLSSNVVASSPQGREEKDLLTQLVEAARNLGATSCKGRGRRTTLQLLTAEEAVPIPYTLLRRLATAVMHVALDRFKKDASCLSMIEKVTAL